MAFKHVINYIDVVMIFIRLTADVVTKAFIGKTDINFVSFMILSI